MKVKLWIVIITAIISMVIIKNYTRYEEDRIVYTSDDGRIKIQFNLGAHGLVISKQGSNGEYYGGYETVFLSSEVCLCISKVVRKLGW
jgi:hypothetical protein